MAELSNQPQDNVNRKSLKSIFVGFLVNLAGRSTCLRAQQACIICDPLFSHVYAIGYNGVASGEDHIHCTGESGACGCVHAEMNALVKLRTNETRLIMLSTQSQCKLCARMIINCGLIKTVNFIKPYRDTRGIKILSDANIHAEPLVNIGGEEWV